MIVEGPEKNGFTCGVWNSAMIADMIFSRFGVSFNPRYLCALLGKIGLSFQKAKFVSDKVGEEEYERARNEWKEKTWPSILKTADAQDNWQKKGAENVWSHRVPVRQIHLHGNMEAKGLLFTYRLPSFPPDFNPIEKLWRHTKKNATHLKYFKTFDALRKSVLAAFGKYMSNAAEVIRVMKKLRSSAELQLLVDSFSGK